MVKEEIIRMAREAGSIDSDDVIETVYNAFAAAEREACARVAEYRFIGSKDGSEECSWKIAAAIRARGQLQAQPKTS